MTSLWDQNLNWFETVIPLTSAGMTPCVFMEFNKATDTTPAEDLTPEMMES